MASEDIHDWCTQNFNLTLEELINTLGDDTSLLYGLDDSGIELPPVTAMDTTPASAATATADAAGAAAADATTDWDGLVKQETASPPTATASLQYQTGALPHQTSPPHQISSPPHQISSPPHQISSPPHQISSPPHQISSPPHQISSPPHQISSPTHQISSPPHQISSPPHQISSPPHQISSPPHQISSPPHQISSPPHQISSPPHQISSLPNQIHSSHRMYSLQHQGASPPHQPAPVPSQMSTTSPPHQTTSPPHQPITSSPNQCTSPPQQSTAQPQQSTSPPQQSTAPSQQSTSPPQQSTSPLQQSTSPPQQSTSPPQQSTSPPQQPSSARSQSRPMAVLASRPVAPVRPQPAPSQQTHPAPVVINDGKAYVINGGVMTPLAAAPANVLKQDQRTLVTSGAPVLYSMGGTPTLVTAGIPLLLETTDRLPIGKLSPPGLTASQLSPEPPRKNAHNAIEKRYRTSINDKIQDMRALVCGPDSDPKMTKSAILKKAIDYIRFLRQQNQRLREELRVLRPPVDPATARLQDLLRPPVWNSPPRSESGPSSPDEGTHSDLAASPGSPAERPSPPQPEMSLLAHDRQGVARERGLSDRTRMTLCMFLLCFLALDPVRQASDWGRDVLHNPAEGASPSGRTMLSAESDGSAWWSLLLSPVTVWVTNLVIFLLLLLNIFIYGERKVALNSDAARDFWKWKEQGERDHRLGRTVEAECHLRRSLRAVGRPLPSSRLQWTVALVWQTFRQASHHIPGGLWLARRGHRILMSRRKREDLYMMSAGYARVYHRLHQLSLSGHGAHNSNSTAGLTVALSALNYAEVAGGTLSPAGRAHIFACAALQLKQSLPEPLLWLARLMLHKGLQRLEAVPTGLKWLATDDGQRFFMEHKWTYERDRDSLYSRAPPAAPVLYVRALFHEHLLERTLQTLTMPGSRCVDVCDAELLRRSHLADALRYCQLIMDTTAGGGPDAVTDDAPVRWWAAVAELVAVWWMGQDERADELFSRAEMLPAALRDASDPLPRAVRVAVQAWRSQQRGGGPMQVLPACRVSAALLEESIAGSQCLGTTSVASQHVQLLVCDLLLQTRTSVWELSRRVPPAGHQLAEFQQVLGCLRALSVRLPMALSRVFLHEATVRMMAGAAPGRTQQLLERSLRHRAGRTYSSVLCGSEKQPHQYVGEREHAIALMMACKHLPEDLLSCPGERAGMLTEAAAVLEKIGDKRRLNDCFQMLKSIGASFPSVT